MPQEKHGIVYIADLYEDGMPEDSGPRYDGYWDSGSEPHQMLENGPSWDDPEEAIRWGRERAQGLHPNRSAHLLGVVFVRRE
jgi:hypothetical protein